MRNVTPCYWACNCQPPQWSNGLPRPHDLNTITGNYTLCHYHYCLSCHAVVCILFFFHSLWTSWKKSDNINAASGGLLWTCQFVVFVNPCFFACWIYPLSTVSNCLQLSDLHIRFSKVWIRLSLASQSILGGGVSETKCKVRVVRQVTKCSQKTPSNVGTWSSAPADPPSPRLDSDTGGKNCVAW